MPVELFADKRTVVDLSFRPDSRRVALLLEDGTVTVRETETGRVVKTLEGARFRFFSPRAL